MSSPLHSSILASNYSYYVCTHTLKKGGFDGQLVGNQLKVPVESARKIKVLNLLVENGVIIEDFRTEDPSLEAAFMQYIGDETSVGGDTNEA